MTEYGPGELKLIGPANPDKKARPMSTRTKARKRAIDILFEAEVRRVEPATVLSERTAEGATPPVREFTRELVEGVVAHLAEIDARIVPRLAEGWTLDRMPRIDRVATRIAVFEIDHTDIPDRVAIAEAIELVDELSTDDSRAFVNGLLGRIAAEPPTQEPPTEEPSTD
jgi:N utilization substance protein B